MVGNHEGFVVKELKSNREYKHDLVAS